MANDLQDLMDTYIMPLALPVLREACVMPALVNTDYSAQAAEQNETIRVPLPQDLGDADDFDTNTGSQSTGLDDPKVDMKLDKWKYKQWDMTDKEMREVKTSAVLPSAAESAVKVLANAVNKDLLGLYADVNSSAGTPGTTPSTKAAIINTRKVLQKNLCPPDQRRLVLNVDAEAEYLEVFSDADKTGSTEALVNASLGRKFGFETFSDQLMPSHINGTAAGAAMTVSGTAAAGAGTATFAGAAGLTLLKGDVFTIAGSDQQYVVTADATLTGGNVLVGFCPALAEEVADGSAVTIEGINGGGSYDINLAFHRNAFTLAMRTLSNEQSENSTISVATDPVTGIPLRLETWREPSRAKRFWRFDVLYGVKTLRPELAARLNG